MEKTLLKRVFVPDKVLSYFCSYANSNSLNGIETLGLLCGVHANVCILTVLQAKTFHYVLILKHIIYIHQFLFYFNYK